MGLKDGWTSIGVLVRTPEHIRCEPRARKGKKSPFFASSAMNTQT